MAAERFPSESPSFYWDSRQDPNEIFRTLDNLLRDLQLRLLKITNDHADRLDGTAWVAPTLLNSWVDFGSGEQVAQYRKNGNRVTIRGLVKSGTLNANVFVLPVGFRPPANMIFATIENDVGRRLTIGSNGSVVTSGGISSAFLSINTTFYTD